jgi:hypothetical protein
MHSQVPFIAEGSPSMRNPRTRHVEVTTSAIHALQESVDLRFSYERSIVQYSHRVCGTHEINQAD